MDDGLTLGELRECAERFRERWSPGRVRGFLVAGSGLEVAAPGFDAAEVIDLFEALPLPRYQLEGHHHTVTVWRRGEESVLVFNGRLHLYQGYRPAQVVAPVRLAALLGAEVMIATNATGGIDPRLEPGSLVVVTDHLNLQGANPLVGSWGREPELSFPDMTQAYDPGLRHVALDAAREAGFDVHEGIYAAMLGPSFETPAEIRMLATLGASVVGMSTVPEVIAARQLDVRVVVLSLVSNAAAGIAGQPLTHGEVLETGRAAAGKLRMLLADMCREVFD